MEISRKTIRRSIHDFLRHYHHFTSAALIIFPVSSAILLSQPFLSSSPLFRSIHSRLWSLFQSAGFPPTSPFFSLLNLKLSQTLSSSLFTLPLTLSFLLVAKSYIITTLSSTPHSSCLHLYRPLLLTHVCNSFILFSANSTALSLLFLAFNSFEALGITSTNFFLFLSAAGAVLYSIILANALVVCNLALIVAGMENCGGHRAILWSGVLIRERAATALSLTIPTNLTLAVVEALFQYRVVKAYYESPKFHLSFLCEATLIAYIYSLILVLDTVIGCTFYRSCISENLSNREITGEDNIGSFTYAKSVQELP
ncbi:uncharacterized protein [Aristolochia californica]|uniref:uncharacterized protein n=1 Tax=Aristolochia californica TaxID=171875 RepID=UPI0035D61DFC